MIEIDYKLSDNNKCLFVLVNRSIYQDWTSKRERVYFDGTKYDTKVPMSDPEVSLKEVIQFLCFWNYTGMELWEYIFALSYINEEPIKMEQEMVSFEEWWQFLPRTNQIAIEKIVNRGIDGIDKFLTHCATTRNVLDRKTYYVLPPPLKIPTKRIEGTLRP